MAAGRTRKLSEENVLPFYDRVNLFFLSSGTKHYPRGTAAWLLIIGRIVSRGDRKLHGSLDAWWHNQGRLFFFDFFYI